eukprot:TRINITY_DN18761_c0_g1_i1.p1 TRINITY_DN18761_c0_g1~~TRINITY_DN18761_c0_g1_i1.p1  ORF type:complete len:334 (+),score=41.85 TRINITY_DN18761_c0_g1_i1:43-1044(+)
MFFFFQAEDGIRDAQESRGLGDVYKRQLPHPPMKTATCHAFRADLMVCLGDTLHVTPAGDIPKIVLRKQTTPPSRVVVCCTDRTALHSYADMACVASPDALMDALCLALNRRVPPFVIRRHLLVGNQFDHSNLRCEWTLFVRGTDNEGNPVSSVKQVQVRLPSSYHPRSIQLVNEPHILTKKAIGRRGGTVELRVKFMPPQPSVDLVHQLCLEGAGGYTHYVLEMTPGSDQWSVRDAAGGPPEREPPGGNSVGYNVGVGYNSAHPSRSSAESSVIRGPSLEQLLVRQYGGDVDVAVQALHEASGVATSRRGLGSPGPGNCNSKLRPAHRLRGP